MGIFLNQLVQLYSTNATNLHHSVRPHNMIVLRQQIAVTSLHLMYTMYHKVRL